ncbi:probable mediator of RNA polymerase II transcription subunit 26b [Musa acuminata AAA Group]|uniref:probable mediator of RNA polymerase II transcription subunit 26b n=1 Tax=Musa acuminata AAA Group TaxID=214697 RepID=UPI0031DFAD04
MASSSGPLDYWRKFFRSANSDIFEVMEHAILVAASDYPQEFRSRRDQIVEKLFAVLLPRCFGCDRVAEGEEGDRSVKRDGEKESKVDSSNDGPEDLNRIVSNYSFDEAEALTEEIEEESQIVGEVLRIKEIFANHHDESDSVLFESLRRLQLMELSVEILKATEIGKAVNGLRRHNSKPIRHLVRTLIEGWKLLVDEWVRATAAIADDKSPESVNPPMEDEEGLPSPPLDEGALFTTQTASIQLSEFFDEMDDDGNFRNNMDVEKQRGNGLPTVHDVPQRKIQPLDQSLMPKEKPETRRQELRELAVPEGMEVIRRKEPPHSAIPEELKQMRLQAPVMRRMKQQDPLICQSKNEGILNKQSKPVIPDSGPGRPPKLVRTLKAGGEMKPKQHQDDAGPRRKQLATTQDKTKFSEEVSIRTKLELAKRKLHEGYQQAENAKKQRTIQVMELHDLPAQRHNKHPVPKSRNNIRNWANGRR